MKAACGNVFKYGDNVDTDVIIPARYLNSSDPKELAMHCMEDIDIEFVKKVNAGDIIVANKNFGCGSSREHAPIAIKAAGVSCVIAETFARIFYRNAINIGLPIIECPQAVANIDNGDEVEVKAVLAFHCFFRKAVKTEMIADLKLEPIINDEADFVIGSRFIKKDKDVCSKCAYRRDNCDCGKKK